jgi:phosphoadenosine phosphosulfate reductase
MIYTPHDEPSVKSMTLELVNFSRAARFDGFPSVMQSNFEGQCSANGDESEANRLASAGAAGASLAVATGDPTIPSPDQAFHDELAAHSRDLEQATPGEIIAWAVARYFPELTMATAFGPEGCCILHMLAAIEPRAHVFNLDTGYQFPETLELCHQIERRYGLQIELHQPAKTVADYEAAHGGPLYRVNPDQCCADRKLAVLRQSLLGKRAWMSGIRRDQSSHRATAPIVGWDKKFGLVKISPLANWTKRDVWKMITDHDIPYNPLHDQGYTSIGCWPCTRSVTLGEDERSGRWSGFAKTECGLHTSD